MRKATLTKQLSFPVTEGMRNLIKSLADHDNVSMGHLLRTALDHAFEHDFAWRQIRPRNPEEGTPFNLDDVEFNLVKPGDQKKEVTNGQS